MARTWFLLSVISLLVLLGQCYSMAAAETNLFTDQSALVVLKSYIKHDPKNTLANNWSNSTFVCNWTGVTCGVHHNHLRVEALNLSFMGLVGMIPPHLGNLTFLANLTARNNSFHGILPSELSRLSQMKYINFGFNDLAGEIPSWLWSLPKLTYMFLYGNQFSGPIPIPVCNLTSLEIIQLSGNQLSGSISKNIGNLTLLKELYLESNKIKGEIPKEINNLQLEKLDVFNNSLEGPIPLVLFNISSLSRIVLSRNEFYANLPDNICQNLHVVQEIYLDRNRLSGPIPSKLWQCKELNVLSLWDNDLSGVVPRNIGNLTKVMMLYLEKNKLTGTIPKELGNLQNLEILYLDFNGLTGVIPPAIFNISTVREISLVNNQFFGGLPSTLGLLVPNLESLWVDYNSFSGPIPKSISNASKLTKLDFSSNHFSGLIPDTLSALENLQVLLLTSNNLTIESTTSKVSILSSTTSKDLRYLNLGDNPLNITLPPSIGNLSTSLEKLVLYNCNLTGSIHDISNLSSLIYLNLSHNGLSGSIPASVGRLQKLQGLDLSKNMLQGSIPFELCHLQRLDTLNLSKNMLLGSIPTCLGNLASSLRKLSLGSNELSSTIPLTFWGLKDILHVDLSSNSLIGSLSGDVKKLKVVMHIDVSNNQLSGNISSNIGDLQDLDYLSLKNNNFEGSIPISFGNFFSIESLDLSNNNLSGEIPKSLEKLSYLKFLNLSFNKLYGEIPSRGPFANFSYKSFLENYDLCGAPRLQVPPCKNASRKVHGLVWRYIIPCVSVMVIMVIIIIILVFRRKRKVKLDSEIILFPDREIWRKVTQLELSRATNGFKEENLLGSGSFGKVYKGILSDGENVAIKVFNSEMEGGFKSFDTECEVLRYIRHRNLVKIITCCSNVDFKALVLEYIPQGSLEKWLYSDEFFLNISQRLNIMIDVASALEYLHYGYSTPIVHCDLKPNNVLLDEDMVAHVVDFGIAKLLSGDDFMTQTMTLATVGYMAPEYGLDGIVSKKGDVYSYGIMLMEVFTRRKPIDEMFAGEMNLKQWVDNSFPHAISNIIDANLLKIEDYHYTIKKDCLSSLIELALVCSATSPEERIEMKNILTALNKIKMKLLMNNVSDK